MGVEQGQIGKTEEMAELNKNQDPGVDSLSAARPYSPLSLRARLIPSPLRDCHSINRHGARVPEDDRLLFCFL